jgi:pimeloyl-ACP methyl ester carboxylesterase
MLARRFSVRGVNYAKRRESPQNRYGLRAIAFPRKRVVPAPRGTLVDKAALALVRSRQPKVSVGLVEHTASEIALASALFDEQGWSSSPATYHRRPPLLLDSEVTKRRTHSWPRRHESITFASGFRPRNIEPGANRWAGNTCNDTVLVRLLRHPKIERPWVVCLHGFGQGASRFDLIALWANYFHAALGFNVAVPVLPLHGPRRSPGSGQLLSIDLAMTLHGIGQAIWDVRRLLRWIKNSTGSPVGVYGLSLGGYLAALLAGTEPVDCVAAGIPFTDVLGLMAHHDAPPEYLDILRSDAAEDAFRVVSPLAVTPLVAPNRRALFVARGDQFIPASQSVALAQAWDQSPVHSYSGGHTGYLLSRETKTFVTGFLHHALCASGP